ncbi:hypothetical protein BLAT2472_10952 [Burkholderia latens]
MRLGAQGTARGLTPRADLKSSA